MEIVKFEGVCPVDAGDIAFADASAIEAEGGSVVSADIRGAYIVDVPPGRILMFYEVEGVESKDGVELEVPSGKLFIGDIAYAFPGDKVGQADWMKFLEKTDYLKVGMKGFYFVDTHGDGTFSVKAEIEKT